MSLAIGPPTKPAPNIVIFIAFLLFCRIGNKVLKRRDENGRLQAGKMVDEEYGLKALHDGGKGPANLLLDHGDILAARVPAVNFPAEEVADSGRLWYAPR